jgi:hypothetical protein
MISEASEFVFIHTIFPVFGYFDPSVEGILPFLCHNDIMVRVCYLK